MSRRFERFRIFGEDAENHSRLLLAPSITVYIIIEGLRLDRLLLRFVASVVVYRRRCCHRVDTLYGLLRCSARWSVACLPPPKYGSIRIRA